MSRSILAFLSVSLLAAACSVPVPSERTTQAAAALAADGEPCAVTADCMPNEKPCLVETCAGGICKGVPIEPGAPCASGVGLCDEEHECAEVRGRCKGWDGPVMRPCDNPSECDDGTPCTADTCEAGWCHHAPLPDGQACGSGILSCKQGLCCVPD